MSLQGIDPSDRVIYVGTFSKAMFPSLRIGYIVVPDDLVNAFRAAETKNWNVARPLEAARSIRVNAEQLRIPAFMPEGSLDLLPTIQ